MAHMIQIPTPFDVGRTNCYVFADAGLTLLDPGPATEEAYEELVLNLDTLGYGPRDIDRILITHPPHGPLRTGFPARGRIRRPSVGARRRRRPVSGSRQLLRAREKDFFIPFLSSMGVPRQLVDTVVGLPEPYLDFQKPVDVDDVLVDGDRVDVGVDLRVIHTPGHAPGSICYDTSPENSVYTGDHVLAEISPNPLLTLAPGTQDQRTRSLPTYIDSLRKLRSTTTGIGYAGHRDPIPDIQTRINEIIEHHQERKEHIAELVAESEPTTAYQIMKEMFPDLPAREMFTGISEVIGHLDLLEDEQQIEMAEIDNVVHYRSMI